MLGLDNKFVFVFQQSQNSTSEVSFVINVGKQIYQQEYIQQV